MRPVLVSVVIPTYNPGDRLLPTLQHLLANDVGGRVAVEIWVVDNGSACPVAPLPEGLQVGSPYSVSCIRLEENAGPSGARNAGFRAARGDLVLFVDDDIEVPRDLIANHVEAHERHPGTVIWGRCMLPPVRSALRGVLEGLGGDPVGATEEFLRVPRLSSGQLSVERRVFAARRSVYAETLRTPAAEEYEFMLRLAREGIPVIFASRIVALHRQSLEIDAVCRQQYNHGLGCAEAACRCPETLELPELRRIIERCASLPKTPRGLARLTVSSRPARGSLLATAGVMERLAPSPFLLKPLYRVAIGASFVGGVRDGLRHFGFRPTGH